MTSILNFFWIFCQLKPIEMPKIQEKFKRLVKKFHPDMNAGNKKFEDKLKIITLAYTQLKNTYKDKIDNKY